MHGLCWVQEDRRQQRSLELYTKECEDHDEQIKDKRFFQTYNHQLSPL